MEKVKDKKKKIEEIKEEKECKCSKEKETNDDLTCECTCNENETELLSKRIKQLEDTLLRSQAELLNYRKRKDEETEKILKYANEDVLKSFLPILDNFERAINMDDNNLDDEVSKFLEGFKLIYKQTKDLLCKFDVVEIEALDKEFDPSLHKAVIMDSIPEKESGIVTEVLQKGYMYKDRVLREAMVKVNE